MAQTNLPVPWHIIYKFNIPLVLEPVFHKLCIFIIPIHAYLHENTFMLRVVS